MHHAEFKIHVLNQDTLIIQTCYKSLHHEKNRETFFYSLGTETNFFRSCIWLTDECTDWPPLCVLGLVYEHSDCIFQMFTRWQMPLKSRHAANRNRPGSRQLRHKSLSLDAGQGSHTHWCVSAVAQTRPVCTTLSSVSSGGCTDYNAETANRAQLTKDRRDNNCEEVQSQRTDESNRPNFPFSAPVWNNGFKSVT